MGEYFEQKEIEELYLYVRKNDRVRSKISIGADSDGSIGIADKRALSDMIKSVEPYTNYGISINGIKLEFVITHPYDKTIKRFKQLKSENIIEELFNFVIKEW